MSYVIGSKAVIVCSSDASFVVAAERECQTRVVSWFAVFSFAVLVARAPIHGVVPF